MAAPERPGKSASRHRVRLEPATPDRVAALLEWMRDFYAHEGIPFDPAVSEPVLRELLARPQLGRVLEIVAGGRPVGYAVLALGFSLEFGGRSAFLDELFVEPASRGRGIGTAALALLQEASRRLGARSLALEVGLENAGAERLYRRAGFTSNGRQLMTRRI
jgi:ribosomal protein S18 acetylase RimI-like enzyme